ncbi:MULTISPECIES: hypothetical protein [unclassified Nitrobacter]|uniref:hypothetical protein n=1 Tax=unclassified Nitrobacter TaxID=2620411 RepID=UPI00030282E6|nr:hypothetical protein [Nitrobacter sp. Nb-311A]
MAANERNFGGDHAAKSDRVAASADAADATSTDAISKPTAIVDPEDWPTSGKTEASPETDQVQGHVLLRWLRHDTPYISMLLLVLAGVVFRLPVIYWVTLTPVFAAMSIVSGWNNFVTSRERLDLVFRLTLDWCAVLLSIFLMFNAGVQGVFNVNATDLSMMTLLALGTFVAGVQARAWQISAVGGALFVATPSLAWLQQSRVFITGAVIVIIALSGLIWWISQRQVRK